MRVKKKLRLKIGEILLKTTPLTPEQLQEAIATKGKKGFPKLLGEILIAKGYVNLQDVETAMAIQYGYPYISLANYHIDPEVCKVISREFALNHKIVPLERRENILTIAMASVFDKILIRQIEEKCGCRVRVFLATPKEIEEAIGRYY